MKKALVMTLIMVLAMAGIASAEAKLGGEFKVEYVVDTDKEDAGKGTAEAPLTLTVTAEEEGVWSISADLEADASKGAEVALGDWTMNLTDDLFVADLWGGGVEKDGVNTPLEFVTTGDDVVAGDEGAHLRITSDVLGYADLTLDYDPDELFVFVSKELNDITVGGAVRKDLTNLTTEGVRAAAHAEYVFGAATLTGEVGMDTAEEEDNFMGGGKVSYKLNDKITLKGKATYEAANVGDELLLEAGADYVEDLFKVTGTLTRTDDLDDDTTEAIYKVKANVTYRTNEDVAFGDLFDDYDTLTGYAAFAEAVYTTPNDVVGVDEKATLAATLKGAGVAVPDMVWVYGEFNYKSDEDKFGEDFKFIDEPAPDTTIEIPLKVEDYFKVKAEGTVQLTDKVKVIPAVKYGQWTTVKANVGATEEDTDVLAYSDFVAKDQNELQLSAAMTYALSDSSEVGVSYTNTTQKFTEATGTMATDQLNDSFAKVYFKTSF